MTIKAKVDAIDSFVRTLKSGGQWDDIQAACVMAGWTNLAGALTPLKGSAPTNNGFLAADLDAGIGLKGNGSAKYLNSNRANNADGQDDQHACVFSSTAFDGSEYVLGSGVATSGTTNLINIGQTLYSRSRSSGDVSQANAAVRFIGVSRDASDSISLRGNSQTFIKSLLSQAPNTGNIHVYGTSGTGSARSDATLSWYSIGSSTDLAALDSAVSTLMADLRAIDEDGFDRDALAYIRNVEAADGAYLETEVKKAINRFFVGTKKDGTFESLKASCILCGARTIAGALVPLTVDYGPELVDINALPTPTYRNASGSGASWDAETRTLSTTAIVADASHPRAYFAVGMTPGKRYRVTGRLSGDYGFLYGGGIRVGVSQYAPCNAAGEFDSVLTSDVFDGRSGVFSLLMNSQSSIKSVTIESLSIREDRSTPTAINFTSANYNRETGLVGAPASGTYIDTNRAGNADGLNDRHLAIYKTSTTLATEWHAGVYGTTAPNHNTGIRGISDATERLYASSLGSEGVTVASPSSSTAGLRGVARTSATNVNYVTPTESGSASINSTREEPGNYFLFALNLDGSPYQHSASRIAFYSVGAALDLSLLDNRVSNLVTEIAAAIP